MRLKQIFSRKKSAIEIFIDSKSKLSLENQGQIKFIRISRNITKNEIDKLLEKLWENKSAIAFYDTFYPQTKDGGAYFSYSTEKIIGPDYWSMTLGNDGWSGGIYQIKKNTVNQQIYNLVINNKIKGIKISNVNFFSHYGMESREKSTAKEEEIYAIHE